MNCIKLITKVRIGLTQSRCDKDQVSEDSAKVSAKSPNVISSPCDMVGLLRNGNFIVEQGVFLPQMILTEFKFVKLVLGFTIKTQTQPT